MPKNIGTNYKWYILTLAVLTHAIVASMPRSAMAVLFKEISVDMGLSLVQLGTVWGMAGLAGMFICLVGGLLGDRFGVKRTLIVSCLLAGLAGALRGVAGNFTTLVVTMFLFGLASWIIPVVGHKVASIWFMGQQLGRANGILSMGMKIGITAGTLISATVLSPWLGGWRNVMFLYGGISIIITILWLTSRSTTQPTASTEHNGTVAFRQAISHIASIKGVWLLGLVSLASMACQGGPAGYLPLYLRDIMGWAPAMSDGAVSAANAASMLSVVPISALSDRIRPRKVVLFGVTLITAITVGLLPLASGAMIWMLLIISGIVRGGWMAIVITIIMEMKGVGAKYAGTAFGLVLGLAQIGSFISPPIGNSFAAINPGLPFVFWASLALFALVGLYFVKETGQRTISTD